MVVSWTPKMPMAKKATKIAFGAQRPLGGLRKLGWQDVLAIYRVC